MIAVNDLNYPVGQDHHRARLSDHDVELMRQMREDGCTYKELAEKFETSFSNAVSICLYRRRVVTATKWRK